ncbi:hypothetical protein COY87_05330 [Candidatus Roizmanbacteria bacterium CG_4_10_14_0_8_um_filter_33_9]|uniref:Uncharacterized protein n=1 Tax=Candidatus Roizmanbacteria bacterium CG_4_10_14_0_8_um_filter_33_9 TaxID=1974826 RepID=A0A2M7QGZ7_9BACT|nr:MAG: hypothetical protein COY87_05330 [Candidatus Roizmanbacteria bacterium CG_4_10_14_0_8_um_filter_33_9]
MQKKDSSQLIEQGIPLSLTVVSFLFFSFVIYYVIFILNKISSQDILTKIYLSDVLVGFTIYLKTSVDFAIFIGNLMSSYPGWKNRIAIEIGTAGGNALGTIMILVIWNFFRSVEWLLALMILLAALVLFKLAQDGLEHTGNKGRNLPLLFQPSAHIIEFFLQTINKITQPILNRILPQISMKPGVSKTWSGLFLSSLTIPFILGLDDFAGYVPIFNIVNVFGFSIGVLFGHMVLNIFLFISPQRTIKVVKNPLVSFFGSIAFILLGLWGLYEIIRILFIH